MEIQDLTKNNSLGLPVEATNKLKKLLIKYTEEVLQPENQDVTLEMILMVLASQFPDLVLSLAEENFIRGYDQAFADMEKFQKDMENNKNNEKV
jgi:hypothetical protein